MRIYIIISVSALVFHGVVSESAGLISISVMEGEPVNLTTDVIKKPHEEMLWYYEDTLIALINGELSKSCVYEGEGGKFRDVLEVDCQTGSLTIKKSRPEHTGRFEANFIESRGSGTIISLNRNRKCNSTKIIQKMSSIGVTIKTVSLSVRASPSGSDKISKDTDDTLKEQDFDKNSPRSSVLIVGPIVAVAVLLLVVSIVGVFYCRRHNSSINAETDKSKLEHLMTA